MTVAGLTSGESALRRARTARNLTLEEAADYLNEITGGATDASLLSAWETGRRRTGAKNRAGCASCTGNARRCCSPTRTVRPRACWRPRHGVVVRCSPARPTCRGHGQRRLQRPRTAGRHGSRSREKAYLAAIETAVAQHPDLVHYRVLYGPPRHRARRPPGAAAGAARPVRPPKRRQDAPHRDGRTGWRRWNASSCASEAQAVVPLPSFHGAEGFDCGAYSAGRPQWDWSTMGGRRALRPGRWRRSSQSVRCRSGTTDVRCREKRERKPSAGLGSASVTGLAQELIRRPSRRGDRRLQTGARRAGGLALRSCRTAPPSERRRR